MIPSAILLIIVVLTIGFLMYIFVPQRTKPKIWPKGISPVINWPVLLSSEVQLCLPKDKKEAIKRYRKGADVSYKQAEAAVNYVLMYPERIPSPAKSKPVSNLKPIVPPGSEVDFAPIDWDLLLSNELQECLKNSNLNKTEAIRRYSLIAQTRQEQAKAAIEYYLNHRDEAQKHIRIYPITEEQEKNIRDMLHLHNYAEAEQAYEEFSGQDEATAREAVNAMKKEIRIEGARTIRLNTHDPRFD